jgi:hypothetical protein
VTTSVVNDTEVGVELTLGESHKKIRIVSREVETERCRLVIGVVVEPHERFVKTLAILDTEAFAPKLNAALEPNLVEKGKTPFCHIVFRLTISLDKVGQDTGSLAGIAETCLALSLDEDHFLNTHQRHILVVGRGTYSVASELDIGVRDIRELGITTIVSICDIIESRPFKTCKQRGFEVLVNPPSFADVTWLNLVIEQSIDAGVNLAGSSITPSGE